MTLSTRAKEAIKTALAITIAYGIALSMGWGNPYWAAFSIVFISLDTYGQSMNKGAMRMLGTLVAGIVAVAIIGIAPQNRWLFITLLSTWVGFCTHRLGGSRHPFFWSYSGYVCIVIAMGVGSDVDNALPTAILRAQETGLGILVYGLVAMLLWPINSGPGFEVATAKVVSTQQQQFKAYLDLMARQGDSSTSQSLMAQDIQEQKQFGQLLEAAETDSHEIRELRTYWRLYQRQVTQLSETMERWRGSLAENQSFDPAGLIRNLNAFSEELDGRFTQMGRMLTHQEPEQHPVEVGLEIDNVQMQSLSHFDKAALTVIRTQLLRLETLTRSMFESVCYIKGFCTTAPELDMGPPVTAGLGILDLDRAAGVVRVMLVMWMSFFAILYIDGLPGGASIVTLTGTLGMVMALVPQVPTLFMFLPAFISTLLGGLLYLLVMPQLTSFWGLGILLFVMSYAIFYLFAAPRLKLVKLFAISMCLTIMSISNQQTYIFQVVSITTLMLPVVFILLAVTAYFPFDLRPRQSFQRLLCRYFRSCEYLMDAASRDPQAGKSCWLHWRKAFHNYEISSLPTKLGVWSKVLKTKSLPGTTPQQITELLIALQGLSHRLQQLNEERDTPQSPWLVRELREDVVTWRLKMAEAFRCLAGAPALENQNVFHRDMADIVSRLNRRIKEAVNQATGHDITEQEGENFYRLLGAYQGVSEALAGYVGSASAIAWTPWQEERFH